MRGVMQDVQDIGGVHGVGDEMGDLGPGEAHGEFGEMARECEPRRLWVR
jgi:hypothetical protein